MKQNKKIAITGGIGSGKSFATDIIKSLGYRTFSCDEIAKNMYDDENLRSAVIKLFGEKFFYNLSQTVSYVRIFLLRIGVEKHIRRINLQKHY